MSETGGILSCNASQEGHTQVVELLVTGGARMDKYNNRGKCPLHYAAQYDREGVVRSLVGLGCDKDMVSRGVVVGTGA